MKQKCLHILICFLLFYLIKGISSNMCFSVISKFLSFLVMTKKSTSKVVGKNRNFQSVEHSLKSRKFKWLNLCSFVSDGNHKKTKYLTILAIMNNF